MIFKIPAGAGRPESGRGLMMTPGCTPAGFAKHAPGEHRQVRPFLRFMRQRPFCSVRSAIPAGRAPAGVFRRAALRFRRCLLQRGALLQSCAQARPLPALILNPGICTRLTEWFRPSCRQNGTCAQLFMVSNFALSLSYHTETMEPGERVPEKSRIPRKGDGPQPQSENF